MNKEYDKRITELEDNIKDIKFALLVGRLVFITGMCVMLCIRWGYL